MDPAEKDRILSEVSKRCASFIGAYVNIIRKRNRSLWFKETLGRYMGAKIHNRFIICIEFPVNSGNIMTMAKYAEVASAISIYYENLNRKRLAINAWSSVEICIGRTPEDDLLQSKFISIGKLFIERDPTNFDGLRRFIDKHQPMRQLDVEAVRKGPAEGFVYSGLPLPDYYDWEWCAKELLPNTRISLPPEFEPFCFQNFQWCRVGAPYTYMPPKDHKRLSPSVCEEKTEKSNDVVEELLEEEEEEEVEENYSTTSSESTKKRLGKRGRIEGHDDDDDDDNEEDVSGRLKVMRANDQISEFRNLVVRAIGDAAACGGDPLKLVGIYCARFVGIPLPAPAPR